MSEGPAATTGKTFDLLVIGGGVNGAAIARDAALRGLSVCLVEMRDWCAATSSRSSKLAHGGLRYLEQFEIGLVHEALRDRERLLQHAPHLVRPLRFLYPIYPDTTARRTVRIGLWIYDLLSRGKSVPKRGFLRRAAALAAAPGLAPDRLQGAATFYDAQIHHVERLVAEMVADARAHGAVTLNHTRAQFLLFGRHGGRIRVSGAQVEDEDDVSFPVRAKAVVNAAGCWVDEVLGPLAEGKPPKVRMTKGSHVVVPKFVDDAIMVRANDGRSFFIIPWQDQCVIGTTDTAFDGDPLAAAADAADVAYLVTASQRYFPAAPIAQPDFTYAGVRALVNQPGVAESSITRRHVLYDHSRRDGVDGLWTLQGGKITTARSLAETCVDRIVRFVGHPKLRRVHPTRSRAYPGGGMPAQQWDAWRGEAIQAAVALGIPQDSAATLIDTYGSKWRDVATCDARDGATRPLAGDRPHLACQVTYAVLHEQARHLTDAALRRTDLGIGPGGEAAAKAALHWMGAMLAWNEGRASVEWQAYLDEAALFAVPQAQTADAEVAIGSP